MQLAWEPVSALPGRVADEIDVDGDGKPDVRVSFVPGKDMAVDVETLNPHYIALHGVRQEEFSRMIAQIDKRIIVRMPVRK